MVSTVGPQKRGAFNSDCRAAPLVRCRCPKRAKDRWDIGLHLGLHKHDSEDELFLVRRGTLNMRLRTGVVTIGPEQFFIVPRGVEHQPYAPDEVEVILFEPASTLNTGNVRNEFTKEKLKRI